MMPKSPNPFLNLPEDKLAMVREYFLKSEFAGQMDFERYLAWLHEDDLIPEDVFAVIEHENTEPKIVYSSVEKLLADLKKD